MTKRITKPELLLLNLTRALSESRVKHDMEWLLRSSPRVMDAFEKAMAYCTRFTKSIDTPLGIRIIVDPDLPPGTIEVRSDADTVRFKLPDGKNPMTFVTRALRTGGSVES